MKFIIQITTQSQATLLGIMKYHLLLNITKATKNNEQQSCPDTSVVMRCRLATSGFHSVSMRHTKF